jgi:hypothetical protein
VTALAAAVLPLIRTRDEVWRWGVANAHGRDMHEAVDILERAVRTEDPATVLAVTHKAIASAISVITRADDSSGIIGDACRRLLDLHPVVAARAGMPAAKLVGWMIDFQFHGKVDYFTIDPVAYAPALGSAGLAKYRARLDEIRAGLGPQPSTAANLRAAAGKNWPDLQPHVMERLSTSPYDAVLFALLTLHDVERAWTHAHELGLSDRDTPGPAWSRSTRSSTRSPFCRSWPISSTVTS